MSTISGSSWDLWAVTMSPAVEKTCSLGTEVAGMERYALASGDSKGYLERFSLVIAVALALDGGRDAKAFRVVCPVNVFVTCAAGFSRELWWFCMCFCIVLVLATVYGIVFLQCLHIVFVLSVTLSPFLISTGKTKMLPHKWFKCGRGIFNTNFTLTLHHADITTHDETTFHLDEKSRRVLIS